MATRAQQPVIDDRSVRDELERAQVELVRNRRELELAWEELVQQQQRAKDERQAATNAINATKALREQLAGAQSADQHRLHALAQLVKNNTWVFWLVVVMLGLGFLASAMWMGIQHAPMFGPPAHRVNRRF